jgi:hypothetical protein
LPRLKSLLPRIPRTCRSGEKKLTLSVTLVSDEGAARLQAALPKCRIEK